MNENTQGVALGSADKSEWPWGSYNHWQCFELENLKLDCSIYDQKTLVPSIIAETADRIFFFDVHVEDRLPCIQTLDKWHGLMNGGKEACIFAAHMPDVDGLEPGQSLWYINRIKGLNGYWNLFEESLEYRE